MKISIYIWRKRRISLPIPPKYPRGGGPEFPEIVLKYKYIWSYYVENYKAIYRRIKYNAVVTFV